jgi:hypothetical protein
VDNSGSIGTGAVVVIVIVVLAILGCCIFACVKVANILRL